MMRIVVKIGTSSVTDEHGAINNHAIETLCNQVAQLREQSHEVLVVTSGAVAGGVAALGMSQRPTDTQTLQALAAVGQSQLMNRYNEYLSARGLIGAQVLLVPNDFIDRTHSVGADALVLLTDIGGLYTADPRTDASATLVEQVGADDPLLSVNAGSAGTARGSGGMASKLSAARIASWSGVRTVIASAGRANVLQDAIDQKAGVGTQFLPHNRNLSARKLWIAFAAQHVGSVVVDDGAKNALITRNTSLLHAGVVEVSGDFAAGDTVEIVDVRGVSFARGMVGIDAVQAGAAAGLQSSDLPEGVDPELVHRDDLVILLDK
jgi:glutamate 5-kinase